MNKPKCMECKHFFITWDQNLPRGCKLYNIKSRDLPSTVVKSAGLGDCQGFEAKKRPHDPNHKDLDKPYQ